MNRREFLVAAAASVLAGRELLGESRVTARSLPRWRGFNLLEKFYRNQRFRETDFQWISDWGFDFVRLPLDYQQWTSSEDPYRLSEEVLEHIDEAVEYGRGYGIHVSLNLHNAPGFTVNASVRHQTSLWHDEEMQRQFAFQWRRFARRYRGISSNRVSFNLVNEPAEIDEETYLGAVSGAIDAIREEDPERLIITDGLNWGRDPIHSLLGSGIAQSTRGYEPMEISHYHASWVPGSDRYPEPQWPVPRVNGRLFGSFRSEWQAPLVLEGNFEGIRRIRVRVGQVSNRSRLEIRADGNVVFENDFVPGSGEGEWSQVVHAEEWNVYQNFYDRDYLAEIPSGTKRIEILNAEGDWMTVTQVGLGESNGTREYSLSLQTSAWGEPQEGVIRFDPNAAGSGFIPPESIDASWLRANRIAPWLELQRQGVGVHVGEWGAHNQTPHAVVLRWAEDFLSLWQEAGFGWALWNLRGSFGIVDSNRSDVDYESFNGHHLDRRLLELLRRY